MLPVAHDIGRGKPYALIVLRFDHPALYRIEVAGHLDDGWTECVRNLAIENKGEQEAARASLTGCLPDQAALLGVLNALYDGRRVVLAVECLTGVRTISPTD
jgi:hypothetical protein